MCLSIRLSIAVSASPHPSQTVTAAVRGVATGERQPECDLCHADRDVQALQRMGACDHVVCGVCLTWQIRTALEDKTQLGGHYYECEKEEESEVLVAGGEGKGEDGKSALVSESDAGGDGRVRTPLAATSSSGESKSADTGPTTTTMWKPGGLRCPMCKPGAPDETFITVGLMGEMVKIFVSFDLRPPLHTSPHALHLPPSPPPLGPPTLAHSALLSYAPEVLGRERAESVSTPPSHSHTRIPTHYRTSGDKLRHCSGWSIPTGRATGVAWLH